MRFDAYSAGLDAETSEWLDAIRADGQMLDESDADPEICVQKSKI